MKMAAKKPVIKIVDDFDDDEAFFSLAMAAEADALASKRRRIADDGVYMAALKGNQSIAPPRVAGNDRISVGGGEGGSCFKCGNSGHWARDCDSGGGGGGGGQSDNFSSGSVDPSITEKSCPCGMGICLVLTANTEKNPGRKFYKCPLRQENGGCGFFEWCDNASVPNSMAGGSYGSRSSLYPGLDCPCGAGLCLILTAKTGKNIGQQFYKCPSNEGSSCGFFKWCNENTQSPGISTTASKTYGNSTFTNNANNTNYTVRTGSSCFKCGKEGHWARDCSTPSTNPLPQIGGGLVSSGTCYKCGKPGHWSRDCTFT